MRLCDRIGTDLRIGGEGEQQALVLEQMLQDGADLNDWAAVFAVDLAASRAAGAPILRLEGFGPV